MAGAASDLAVVGLGRADREGAVHALVESFRDYPVMRYFLQDSGALYLRHLATLAGFSFDARFARGYPVTGVRREGQVVATALISDPGPAEPNAEVVDLFARLAEDIGESAVERMATYEEVAKVGRPSAPFHYLGMVGVLPEHQGRGLGGLLMKQLKRMVRDHPTSTGICLNTEAADNVPLYEHLGFTVVGEAEHEGVETWCMFWQTGESAPRDR